MTHLSKDNCTCPDVALETVPMAIAHPLPSCLLTTTLSCTDRGEPCPGAPTFPCLASSWENQCPSRTAGLATKSARHRPSLSLNARALDLATEGCTRCSITFPGRCRARKVAHPSHCHRLPLAKPGNTMWQRRQDGREGGGQCDQ